MAKPDGSSELPDQESSRSFPVLASPVDIKSIDDVEKGLRNVSPFVFESIRAQNADFQSCSRPNLVTCLHVVRQTLCIFRAA